MSEIFFQKICATITYLLICSYFVVHMYNVSKVICKTDVIREDGNTLERFLGSRWDASDSEFKSYLLFSFTLYQPASIICYILTLRKIIKNGYQTTIVTILMQVYFHGLFGALFYSCVSIVLLFASFLYRKYIWYWFLLFLLGSNTIFFQNIAYRFSSHPEVLLTSIAWVPLKIISAVMDQEHSCDLKKKILESYNYIMIPFNIIYGPWISFSDSKMCKLNKRPSEVFRLICHHFAVLGVLSFGKFFLHFHNLLKYDFFLQDVSGLTRMIAVFFCATYYCSKIKCMYGLSLSFFEKSYTSRHPLPKCVGFVYDYTNLWRTFDVSMHFFIKRYVITDLTTLMQSYFNGIMVHTVSVSMGFLVVPFFHGFSLQLLLWTATNFLIYMLRKAYYKTFCTGFTRHIIYQLPSTVVSMITSVFFFHTLLSPWTFFFTSVKDPLVWFFIGTMILCKKIIRGKNIEDF